METTLALATKTNLNLLLEEFKNAGALGDYWAQQERAENTRLARWDGQSEDGKKWDRNQPDGKPAFPWDGASDVRCYQADEVINENVAMKISAFWRSDIRVEGVEPDDLAPGSSASTFMEWMRNNDLRKSLKDEVELSAQYDETYGWYALHVTWERLISYRWNSIDLEALSALAQKFDGAADSVPPEHAATVAHLSAFPQLVMDPEQEDLAVNSMKFLYRLYVNQSMPSDMEESDIPDISTSKAIKCVRELRKVGQSRIPFPYVCKNKPCITALKPWRDIVVPSDTTDLQSARAIFVRQFMSEADLRGSVLSDGWDKKFVDAAVQTKGRVSTWSFTNQGTLNPLYQWNFTQSKNNLIEIVWAYHKAVDDDGITAVYYTVFSPHLTSDDGSQTDIVAKSDMLDYPAVDEYPVFDGRRELLDRQVMSSRGVPEIVFTSQREEKVLRDAVMDWNSISIIPPVNVYKGTMGQRYKFAPKAENLVVAGREPRFMEIPAQGPALGMEYLQFIKTGINHYFGRVREDVPPQLSQLLAEPRVDRFLSTWGNALKLAYCLYLHFAPETFQRVTNQPEPPKDSAELDFIFHFDVAQLNPEMMEKKLDGFSKLLPEDSSGVIDRGALVRAKARMLDPALAREMVMDQGPASQALFEKVKSDLVAMSDGNEASYSDAANDPTAKTRGQYLQQIIQNNIKYLQRLEPELLQNIGVQVPPQLASGQGQTDPIFSALLEKYLKNLQLGISQQQNKVIGRIGVS